MKMTKNKFVLVFGPGTMAGVFGGGVANTLQKANFYKNIEAIYGYSAGCLNAAYFLAKQTYEGTSIYWENLTEGFMSSNYLDFFSKTKHIVDIDYLFDFVENKKKLNIKKIKKSKIPLYIKILYMDKHVSKFEKLNTAKDIFSLLKASVSITPFYKKSINYYGKELADGAIKEENNFKYIIKKHPGSHIILILNHKIEILVLTRIFNTVTSFLTKTFFSKKLAKHYGNKNLEYIKKIRFAKASKRITIIEAKGTTFLDVSTTSKKRLRELFKQGEIAGKQILKMAN